MRQIRQGGSFAWTPWGLRLRLMSGDTFLTVPRESGGLQRWATRAGHSWPCSTLAGADNRGTLLAHFDPAGDLVDLVGPWPDDIDGTEFSAWADTVRAYTSTERAT